MTWTTLEEIRDQLQRLWNGGRILAELAGEESLFPRRLNLKKPTSAEMAEHYGDVRKWISHLQKNEIHYRLVWRRLRHRTLGTNDVPAEIWIDSLENALALIRKEKQGERFRQLVVLTGRQQPALMIWLAKRPLQALALADDWQRLLAVVSWLQEHPRPALYLRQIDIEGVDSKFIEHHRKVLAELFDLVLPEEYIDSSHHGVSGFCRRYGFLDKPARIRFRLLDPSFSLLPTSIDQDITVTGASFAKLDLPPAKVFITENEINFLTFPRHPQSMVIFGAGYGFDILSQASWLHHCEIFYWGDIDTHGFAILNQLRQHFPAAGSFLMDRPTLLAHQKFWDREPQPVKADLARLTEAELSVFNDLRSNTLGEQLRLEQERIGFQWVKEKLERQ